MGPRMSGSGGLIRSDLAEMHWSAPDYEEIDVMPNRPD